MRWRGPERGRCKNCFNSLFRAVGGLRSWVRCAAVIAGISGSRTLGDMPRAARLDAPGALHHIIARGIERRCIFRRQAERQEFLDRLAPLVNGSRASLAAWCLMANHVHLLLRTGSMPVSNLMNRLLGAYARRFNLRHRRVGHLFQGRFKSTVVEDDPYLLQLVRYIHLNPLRARIVPDLDALDRYPWSGHAVLMGARVYTAQDTGAVLGLFASEPARARPAYRAFVADGLKQPPAVNLEGGGLKRSFGVWGSAAALRRGREQWTADERILGDRQFVQQMLGELEARQASAVRLDVSVAVACVGRAVSRVFNVRSELIASRSCLPAAVAARAVLCWIAVVRLGLIPAQVARALNVSRPTVQRAIEQAPALATRWALDLSGIADRAAESLGLRPHE